MTRAITLALAAAVAIAAAAPTVAQSSVPETVSPGALDRITGVEQRCPTFSWQALPDAVGYELVVYRLTAKTASTTGDDVDREMVLYVELPAGVMSWTPPLESGLTPGEDYAWFIRADVEPEENSDQESAFWSVPRYFSVSFVAGAPFDPASTMIGGSSVESTGTRPSQPNRTEALSVHVGAGRAAATSDLSTKALQKDVATAPAAIRGEIPDATGETYGVVGTSHSPDGAGIAAANSANGADLILDGTANGLTNTTVTESGLDRSSSTGETFMFTNSGGGDVDVHVQGDLQAARVIGDGSSLTSVDAELLDGNDSTDFALDDHSHDDRYFSETELATSGGGGAVHWDNLFPVPTGLNDGDQDTTYTAGTGLELAGTVFRTRGSGLPNLLFVSALGGDFTSIQSAIDSITDADADNPYLVWVGPGFYTEAITLKPHVHLQGAGRKVTIISSDVIGGNPPTAATVILSTDSTVRDMRLQNIGAGYSAIALLAPAGTTSASVLRADIWTLGSATYNDTVVADGSGTYITLEDVDAIAQNAPDINRALVVQETAWVNLIRGSYSAVGSDFPTGIFVDSGSSLTAFESNASGILGVDQSNGLDIKGGIASLQGGTYRASGGANSHGIRNYLGGSLDASDVNASGESPSAYSDGLLHSAGVVTTLRGGNFLGNGGSHARGIRVVSSGVLSAETTTARAKYGSTTSEALRADSGSVTLRGGTLAASSGAWAKGMAVAGNAKIEATGIAILATDAAVNVSVDITGSAVVKLGTTQLEGPIIRDSGSLTCFQVCDSSFTAYSCP